MFHVKHIGKTKNVENYLNKYKKLNNNIYNYNSHINKLMFHVKH